MTVGLDGAAVEDVVGSGRPDPPNQPRPAPRREQPRAASPRRDLRREQDHRRRIRRPRRRHRSHHRIAPPDPTPREHHSVNTSTKAPPRTPGRGLRHHRSTAPTVTPTSSSSVALNNLHHLAVLATSRLCQGCSHPFRHHPDRTRPQLHPTATTARRCRSSTSTQTTEPHGAVISITLTTHRESPSMVLTDVQKRVSAAPVSSQVLPDWVIGTLIRDGP